VGILTLDVAGLPVSLLTTDPNAPDSFCQTLPKLDRIKRAEVNCGWFSFIIRANPRSPHLSALRAETNG